MRSNSNTYSKSIHDLSNIKEDKNTTIQPEVIQPKYKTKTISSKIYDKLVLWIKNSKIMNLTTEKNTNFSELKNKNIKSDKNFESKTKINIESFQNNDIISIKISKIPKNKKDDNKQINENSNHSQKNKKRLNLKNILYIFILIPFFIFLQFYNEELNKLKNSIIIIKSNIINSIRKTKNQKNNRKLETTYNGGYITIICSDSTTRESIFNPSTFLTSAKIEALLEINGVQIDKTNTPYYISDWSGKTLKIYFSNPINYTMINLFYSKNYIKEIDLTKLKIGSNCKSMYGTFQLCNKLTFANLSHIDISSVTTMELLFYDCDKLTSIDMSYINAPKLTSFMYSFKYCESLKSVNLKNMITGSLNTCFEMFRFDSELTNVNLNGFDTSTVTTMYAMFHSCSSLTSLDLCSFTTEKLTTNTYMFYNKNDNLKVHLNQNNANKISSLLSQNNIEMKSCEKIIIEDFSFKGCVSNKVEFEMKVNFTTGYKDGTLFPQLKDENNNIYDINCVRKNSLNEFNVIEKCELDFLSMKKFYFSIYLENLQFYSDEALTIKEADVLCYLSDDLEFTNNKLLTDDTLGCGKIQVNSISDIDSCVNGKHSITININYQKYLIGGKYKVIFNNNIVFDCEKITSEEKDNIECLYEKYIEEDNFLITFNHIEYYYISDNEIETLMPNVDFDYSFSNKIIQLIPYCALIKLEELDDVALTCEKGLNILQTTIYHPADMKNGKLELIFDNGNIILNCGSLPTEITSTVKCTYSKYFSVDQNIINFKEGKFYLNKDDINSKENIFVEANDKKTIKLIKECGQILISTNEPTECTTDNSLKFTINTEYTEGIDPTKELSLVLKSNTENIIAKCDGIKQKQTQICYTDYYSFSGEKIYVYSSSYESYDNIYISIDENNNKLQVVEKCGKIIVSPFTLGSYITFPIKYTQGMIKSGTLTIVIKNNNNNEIYVICKNLVDSNNIQECTYKGLLLSGDYYFVNGVYNNLNNELAKVSGDTNIIMLNIISCIYGSYNKYNSCLMCPEHCSSCSFESLTNNLCLTCNNDNNYYPLQSEYEKIILSEDGITRFHICYNETTKISNTYLNLNNKQYENCFKTCATCNQGGTEQYNNCITCSKGYTPQNDNQNNCVIECESYYYYDNFNNRKCTEEEQCPSEYPLLTPATGKCVDKCDTNTPYSNSPYIIRYNGECIDECKNGLVFNQQTNLCEENKNFCTLTSSEIKLPTTNFKLNNLELYSQIYAEEYSYTENHVSYYYSVGKTNNYAITIYKNTSCLQEVIPNTTKIDFNECYNKVINYYNYTKDTNLIIATIDVFRNNQTPINSYIFYDPLTGDELETNEVCKNITINKNVNLSNIDGIDQEAILYFDSQGINLLDINDPFYIDLCAYYESKYNVDIPINLRYKEFFPNIELCEEGCKIKNVNSSSLSVNCLCSFSSSLSTKITDNPITAEVFDFLKNSNIQVLKCTNLLIKPKLMKDNIGLFLSISTIIIQIIVIIIYFDRDRYIVISNAKILWEQFIQSEFANNINKIGSPPKISVSDENVIKYKNKRDIRNINKRKTNKRTNLISRNEYNYNDNEIYNKDSSSKGSEEKVSDYLTRKNKKIKTDKSRAGTDTELNDKNRNLQKDDANLNMINDFMEEDLNECNFFEAKEKDKRSFCEYYWEQIKRKSYILSAFVLNENFRPKSYKIFVLIFSFQLYFVINGLLINEEYITTIYNKKDKNKSNFKYFIDLLSDSLSRIAIASTICIFMSYLTDFIFISEESIRDLFQYEKSKKIMQKKYKKLFSKYELIMNIFVILNFIFMVFFLYYLTCFNNVYKYSKYQWLYSSLIIIVFIQLLPFILVLLMAIFRAIGLKCDVKFFYEKAKVFDELGE